jgi:hypothetical protein
VSGGDSITGRDDAVTDSGTVVVVVDGGTDDGSMVTAAAADLQEAFGAGTKSLPWNSQWNRAETGWTTR